MSVAETYVPAVPGSVAGVRYWLVGESPGGDPAMRSPRGLRWEPGGYPTEASCPVGEGVCPGHDCFCGIHAYHPFCEHFQPEIVAGRVASSGFRMIWGEIEAWGEIEVHEHGFRAQYARPALIYIPVLIDHDLKARIKTAADWHAIPWCNERKWWGGRRSPRESRGLSRTTVKTLLGV